MADSVIVIGDALAGELRLLAPNGALTRIIRIARTSSNEEYWRSRADRVDTLVARALDRMRADPRLASSCNEACVRASFDPPYLRDERPTFQGVELSRDGTIWVRELVADTDAPARWIVFGRDGLARAIAEISRNLTVTDRGDAYVVAVRHDDFDVPYVGVWWLHAVGSRR